MKSKIDITFLLGVFTSAVIVWIFLYNTIIDLTTAEPAAISLLYLCISHYFSSLCVMFSFILLLRHCLEISLDQHEINRLKRFEKLATYSQKALFSIWGPMFIFSISALLSQNIFSGSKYDFLQEAGGFLIGAIISILFFFLFLRINIFNLLFKAWSTVILAPFFMFAYISLLSVYSADVKYKVEKDFYQKNEIARFEIKRKGYLLLPRIKYVVYNFYDSLSENSEGAYFVDLSKDTFTKNALIEITYYPQIFEFPMKKYIYINKTDK